MTAYRKENSPYAPIRYAATRPYAESLGQRSAAHARHGETARMRYVQDELFKRLGQELGRLGKTEGPGPVQSELLNVQLFGRYDAAGRVIFDVARPLLQQMLDSPADDTLPCARIVAPTALPVCAYLHFGRDAGLQDDMREIEGAFVESKPDALRIELVPAHFGHPLFFRLPGGEQTIGLDIDLADAQRPLASAVDQAVSDAQAVNSANLAQLAEIEAQLSAQYGKTVKVPYMIEPLAEREALMRRALSLTMRILAHLHAVPGDVRECWQPEAPADLVAQADDTDAKPGTRKTAANSLSRAGFQKIRTVGTAAV